jgi:hypothetical protein
MGTPHPTTRSRSRWLVMNLILKTCLRMSRSELAHNESEVATLTHISAKFEEIISSTSMVIVSVYEKNETNVGDRLFMSHKKLVSCTPSTVRQLTSL